VGTSSNGLYGAIFDVGATPEEDLFGGMEEDERPALRSIASSTRLREDKSRERPVMNVQGPPMSPKSPTRTGGSPDVSPMMRPMTISTANLEPGQSGETSTWKFSSPLARLFTGDSPIRGRTTNVSAGASLKKVETLLEDIKQLPVNKVTEEMRELQVRDIRLLTLFVSVPLCSGSLGHGDLHSVITL